MRAPIRRRSRLATRLRCARRITKRRVAGVVGRMVEIAAAAASAARSAWRRMVAAAIRFAGLAVAASKVAALVAIVSLVLAGGAFAAGHFYGQFGAPAAAVNARDWASRRQSYAITTCRTCHAEQSDAKVAGLHVSVTCEACHGPGRDHPGTDPNVLTRMDAPTSDTCVTCHARSAGMPASFPSVVLATHYGGGVCLRCHDAHSIKAVAPPPVTHPLASLPACTTCHAPDGLKKVPAGHEMVADPVCLSCHATPDRLR